MKVLVTGGFGALGMNLIKVLQSEGIYDIHVIDNFSSGTVNFDPAIKFSYLDISNTEKVQSFFKNYKPHYIYHLAAHFANQNSVDHPLSDASTNVLGIINIFEAQRTNTELKKMVYASSSCVYGNLEHMNESATVKPYDTPYAINKYVGELYAKYYSAIHNLPVVCARIFNSYGPGEMPGQYRNVIPNFVKKALDAEPITITGTGEETRDFTFVADTIQLLMKIALSEYRSAEIFNGGTGTKTSIKTLVELIVKLTGSSSEIIYKERRNWDLVKDRCSDVARSKELLGYNPSTALEQGLRETISWIKEKERK